jgi:hypothetical protein
MTEITPTHSRDAFFLSIAARLAAAGASVVVSAALAIAVVVGFAAGTSILPS